MSKESQTTVQQRPSIQEAAKSSFFKRRLPVGAEVLAAGGVHFRVWAPASQSVGVELGANEEELAGAPPHWLEPEPGGYFSGVIAEGAAGMCYRVRVDSGTYPDPASRFQPEGPHGPSEVVDPEEYVWRDGGWRGLSPFNQVFYELHLGTFTAEGTWVAAAKKIPHLMELGVTVVEVMPVADFPGAFGWGYDGVNLFAPTRLYGRPNEFRAFVDQAHQAGIGVILDVVYNHFGPDGNYLKEFSKDYFTDRYQNEWGEALNFDGDNSGPVREFVVSNAGYWIDEYHLDGLRLDATQQIYDCSPDPVLAAIARQVRVAARGRGTWVVAENECQQTRLVRPVSRGGYGLDALWNDDFHHTARVALTGQSEAYYTDYRGTPQEFVAAMKWGYLFQGQRYKWQRHRRGTPTFGLKPRQFINYLQNHDQVANSLRGVRVHELASPGRLRALTALLLLGPGSPMLFQGQEFAASSPFLFFADHPPELAKLVAAGRKQFLSQFPRVTRTESQALLADPASEDTFHRCRLDFSERERHPEAFALHKDLIRLRREDPVLNRPRRGGVDGAVLGAEAFLVRFFARGGDDRLLLVNLGGDLRLDPAPEPLLAPVEGRIWQLKWSSEDPRYGGCGTPPLETEENWWLPAQAAVLLEPGIPPEQSHGKADTSD